MATHPHARWRMPREFSVRLRSWGDETVAYHDGSGDTHLLGPIEAAAIHALRQTPSDLDGLTRQVAADLGLPPDTELATHLAALIDEFRKLGLVEPDVT